MVKLWYIWDLNPLSGIDLYYKELRVNIQRIAATQEAVRKEIKILH